jgi:DNA polymerase I-like protein with 3'-5' exonuclease and polymerase domains
MILVQTHDEFSALCKALETYDEFVIDLETTGLSPYTGDQIVGISYYFPQEPEQSASYYLPLAHGVSAYPHVVTYDIYAGTKEEYFFYWYDEYARRNVYRQNYKLLSPKKEWLRKSLVGKTVYGHNIKFDLHFLRASGFEMPAMAYDTILSTYAMFEDFRGLWVDAPFKWAAKDATAGLCTPSDVGLWAVDPDTGDLLKKRQPGNYQLKWLCAYLGVPEATTGESELVQELYKMYHDMAEIAYIDLDNPFNRDLLYKRPESRYSEKQYQRIFKKLALDFETSKIASRSKSFIWALPPSVVYRYACFDTKLTWDLWLHTTGVHAQWGEDTLRYHQQLQEANYHFVFGMESHGVVVDIEKAKDQRDEIRERMTALERKWGFNIASNTQLLDYFANAGIRVQSVDSTVLARLVDEGHEIAADVLQYRHHSKAANTYLDAWVKAAVSEGGRSVIHSNFNMAGTKTGRLSSSAPINWQNIPERGYDVKRAIVAPEDHFIMSIDYDRLELHLTTHLAITEARQSPDETMFQLLTDDVDVHQYIADELDIQNIVFPGMSEAEIRVQMLDDTTPIKKIVRHIAKQTNFLMVYGGTYRAVMRTLNCSEEAARVLVYQWDQTFPAYRRTLAWYQGEMLKYKTLPGSKMHKGLYVTCPISGKHRKAHPYETYVQLDNGGWFNPREKVARDALSSVAQGLGAWMTFMSATKFIQQYGEARLQFFTTTHDSLDFYVYKDDSHYVHKLIEIMVDWPIVTPLSVGVSSSELNGNWKDMKELTAWGYYE